MQIPLDAKEIATRDACLGDDPHVQASIKELDAIGVAAELAWNAKHLTPRVKAARLRALARTGQEKLEALRAYCRREAIEWEDEPGDEWITE